VATRDGCRSEKDIKSYMKNFSPDGRQAAQANAQVTEHARER
jgi:hypothetical protein